MNIQLRRFLRASFLSCFSLAICAGCSGGKNDSDPKLVPVTGTVTYDGKPLSVGTVMLASTGAQGASGKIEGGSFTIMTSPTAPGIRPGEYKVSIVAKDGVDTMDEKGKPLPAKNLIPDRYGNVDTSGLTAKVESGGSKLTFDLKP